MTNLPRFPLDDQTLDLLSAAVTGTSGEGGRSSVAELCDLYSQLGGSDTAAVAEDVDGIQVMQDPCYHPNDIIAALVDEVRALRAQRPAVPAKDDGFARVSVLSSGSCSTYGVHCAFDDPADAARAAAELTGDSQFNPYFDEELPVMPPGRLPQRRKRYIMAVNQGHVEGRFDRMWLHDRDMWEWEVGPEFQETPSYALRAPVLAEFSGTDKERVTQAAEARLAELRGTALEGGPA